MALQASDILSTLRSGEYAPLYFLQGEEPFFIDQVSRFIEKNALDEAQKGFNQIILYGRDVTVNDVLQNARRFPMMSDRQVVIVKEAQEITDLKRESGRSQLEAYITNPTPSTILVFCHKHKKIDGRTALGGLLKKHTVFLDTKKVYENQVPGWIETQVRSMDLAIAPDASALMASHLGNNLERIFNELEKMRNNLKGEKQINVQHIQRFVGINKDFNVFEFTKALLIKDVRKAHQIVDYFDANIKNNPPIPIVAMVYTTFSKLLVLHSSGSKDDKGLASALRINPFFLKEYKIGAGNYSSGTVIRNLKFIHEADLQLKGVNRPSIGDGQVLRDLTYQLMH